MLRNPLGLHLTPIVGVATMRSEIVSAEGKWEVLGFETVLSCSADSRTDIVEHTRTTWNKSGFATYLEQPRRNNCDHQCTKRLEMMWNHCGQHLTLIVDITIIRDSIVTAKGKLVFLGFEIVLSYSVGFYTLVVE